MKKKVHKVTLLIVDLDDLGTDEVKLEIENVRYPNHCLAPEVMEIETEEVEWTDDHPLNKRDSQADEFKRLFRKHE